MTQIPGLPDRSDYGDLSSLQEGSLATLVRQKHNAERARLHEDLRIGGPGGLYSWAVPKFLPEDDSKHLAIQQPVHQWSYKDFQGRLKHGYGKGTVEKIEESPVVILKNSPNHLMFTRGDTKDAPLYSMVRTAGNNWLVSIHKPDQPPEVMAYPKEHFKAIPIEQVPDLIEQGATLSKKIDGAGVLLSLGAKGARAFGIRQNAQGRKPEYTDIIGGLRSLQIPPELQGTLVRGEVFGRHNGRSIGANELGGYLNSTVRNAAYKKSAEGVKLLIAALAIHNKGQDDYSQGKVTDLVNKLNASNVVGLDRYAGKRALDVLRKMKAGSDPLTHEGVVVHQDGKRPLKAKFRDDADVIIRRIFNADTKGEPRAGGFEYSLPGSDQIIGRVGTGFSHEMLKDMMNNPDAYIGRTARIHSQEQYPSGAYRSPGFVAVKED